jgi:RNA polymerase sigma factor (TIGR02999 family)
MSDVNHLLSQIEAGNRQLIDQLLPLVYEELRAMAARHMAKEGRGHTLQATALVHDVWLRLVAASPAGHWSSRRYFFAAAAEAMRRILVDHARTKLAVKRGGQQQRVALEPAIAASPETENAERAIAISDALDALAKLDAPSAELAKIRYFGGFTITEAAEVLGLSRTEAYKHWRFAKTWLAERLEGIS